MPRIGRVVQRKQIPNTFIGKKVVGREGFEPSTNWLKANCSTS